MISMKHSNVRLHRCTMSTFYSGDWAENDTVPRTHWHETLCIYLCIEYLCTWQLARESHPASLLRPRLLYTRPNCACCSFCIWIANKTLTEGTKYAEISVDFVKTFFTCIILMFAETATDLTFCHLKASLQRQEKHSALSRQHPGYGVAKWAGCISQCLQIQTCWDAVSRHDKLHFPSKSKNLSH